MDNERNKAILDCLKALPPERIIHDYMPSQNTPQNRAWNEYRAEAIKQLQDLLTPNE